MGKNLEKGNVISMDFKASGLLLKNVFWNTTVWVTLTSIYTSKKWSLDITIERKIFILSWLKFTLVRFLHNHLDLLMVVLYFVIIFIIGIYKSADQKKDATNYFLSGRKLRWPSRAMSTIATNIQAGHFVGMGGAAYTYGLAQANFEIGAIFGVLGAMEKPSPLVITRGGTILWKDGQLTPQKDASEETEFATGMVFDLTGEGATSIYIAVAGLEGSLTEARKIYRETTSNPLSHSVESGNYYKKLLAKSVTIVSPDKEFNEGYR